MRDMGMDNASLAKMPLGNRTPGGDWYTLLTV
jgi:hypothetical protein